MAYEAAEASASEENSPTTDENDRACALACNVCVCVGACVCVFMYVTVRVYARTFTKNEHRTTSAKGQTYVCE